jgi:N-acetyl-gamma-glutamyl-phosphate reductase
MALNCSVLGASGYSGGEIIRLLAAHPALSVTVASASSRAGSTIADLHPHLSTAPDLKLVTLEEALSVSVDVAFSCLPHGELAAIAGNMTAALIVDLSEDFRADGEWVYGLSEFARDKIAGSSRIANPGCYPTASLLALLPFAAAGLISGPVVIDAISGVSGAGRKSEDRLLFANLDGGIGAYGTTAHRHIPEIERGLATLAQSELTVSFTPHLAPIARGLLATVRAPLTQDLDDNGILGVLHEAYAREQFVTVVDSWPQTKAVAGSNHAQVTAAVDERAGMLVASCAIDNLGKGAAGQAIQNVNIALGLDEGEGLASLGVWP